jgi:DNA polymerase-4
MSGRRVIAHVDMDAFFASIVQLDRPELRGKPVLVGHDGPRGVVTAASYESRPFGCRSAMPMAEAKRRCPQAAVVGVPRERIGEMSRRLRALLGEFSPLVEPISVDEAFVDLSGTERLLGPPREAAEAIRRRIGAALHLTGSVGVAPNKFLAKLASDEEKPNGVTVVPFDDPAGWLAGKPIGRMWGIGPVAEGKLRRFGLTTIGDLQRADPAWLGEWLGEHAGSLRALAFGRDDRPVVPEHQAKSIGHEQTFGEDLREPAMVRGILLEQVEQVGARLRQRGLRAGGVTLKIRFGDFQTINRSTALSPASDTTAELWRASRGLFDRWAGQSFRPVRLIGMAADRLRDDEGQLDLFGGGERRRQRHVDDVVDRITDRFGRSAIHRAGPGA